MKPLRFAPGVEAEIDAAGDYYEDQRRGLAGEFLDAVDDALQRLLEHPQAHGLVVETTTDQNIRQVIVRRFPYRVVFHERGADVLVLACMHARRSPGYWRSRQL